jgi:hypothetical protein
VSPYFGSKVVVEWLDQVVRIVSTNEESHPVGIPQNLAHNKHAIVTEEAPSSVDRLWHLDIYCPSSTYIVLPLREELQVQRRTRGGHCKPAKQD